MATKGRLMKPLLKRLFHLRLSSAYSTIIDPSNDAKKRAEIESRLPEENLFRFIRDRILTTGPISVADYMKMCLASPNVGYYASENRKEILGGKGDFITTPELTQMLGEMLAIWIYYEVSCMAHPGPIQLIELGPGSGALSSDILRTINTLGFKADKLSAHLVEISSSLRKKQLVELCSDFEEGKEDDIPRAKGTGKYGHSIQWYTHMEEVPRGFSVILAHEFFDALPAHQFRRNDSGEWREIFVDFDSTKQRLKFALAPTESLHQKVWIPEWIRDDPNFTEYEASPNAVTLSQDVAVRVSEDGGAALIIDYGHSGDRKRLSFRAYSQHNLVDPLERPGAIDLTCDVNFGALKEALNDDERCCVYGPITQREFLSNMGVQYRYEKLLKMCKTDDYKRVLRRSYEIMMGPTEMGDRFKVLAAFPKTMEPILVNLRKDAVTGFFDCTKNQSNNATPNSYS